MRKMILLFCAVIVIGCAAEENRLRSYLDDPGSIIRDPHYSDYQEQLDDLEHKYLYKEMTYAEYLEEKKRIDQKYTREVQARENIVENYR